MHPALRRDVAQPPVGERRVGLVLGDGDVAERCADAAVVDPLTQRPAEVGVGVQASFAGMIGL